MTVATVDENGMPFQRIVLLKNVDKDGFVFYTNLGSRKAQQLEHNSNISLHFPWHPLERQVHITGVAEKLTAVENMKYFTSRPKRASWPQSRANKVAVFLPEVCWKVSF